MSAAPTPVPRATGEARVVRARISARERLRRIIQFRELLVGMVRKELKIKYKNSVLGFAWSLLNPLLYLVVFWIAFDNILGSPIHAFPIWLLSGLLVWNLFSIGLSTATTSVVVNAGLVKKVAFPREILPLASVGSTLVHFFLQGAVLLAVLVVVQWNVAWTYVPLVPVALVALLLITAALGILLAALNVYLRDTQHFVELALLAWFWMTPIVYNFQTVGLKDSFFAKLWACNPITPVVIIFQRAIYGTTENGTFLPNWTWGQYAAYLGLSFAFGIVVLAIAIRVFAKAEVNFAEEL
jgi:ABC-2 type transport system permease protein